MTKHTLTLSVLDGAYAVCRFAPDADVSPDVLRCAFASVTRTEEELSVVLPEANLTLCSGSEKCEKGWRVIKVEGPLDFALTGIMASLATALAEAGISIFVVSTYDTDYLLLKEEKLEEAIETLRQEGHQVKVPGQ